MGEVLRTNLQRTRHKVVAGLVLQVLELFENTLDGWRAERSGGKDPSCQR